MEKVKKSAGRGRPSRRKEMVAAAEELVRSEGLAHATTKAIAARAGCSEAALYVHFKSRSALLLAVLEESLPDMLIPLRSLEQAVGHATPKQNLHKAFKGIFAFHQRVTPVICSLFAEPKLLAEYRDSLLAQNKGPQGAVGRLHRYIAAEQKLGRIDHGVDAEIAAMTLMANSFFLAFTGQFFGIDEPVEAYCRKLIAQAINF